jgi:hypothetical protein
MNSFQIGDRVAYSAKFLRQIGLYGHGVAQDRGTVTQTRKLAFSKNEHVRIKWDNDSDELRAGALSCNLVRVKDLGMEAANAEHARQDLKL